MGSPNPATNISQHPIAVVAATASEGNRRLLLEPSAASSTTTNKVGINPKGRIIRAKAPTEAMTAMLIGPLPYWLLPRDAFEE